MKQQLFFFLAFLFCVALLFTISGCDGGDKGNDGNGDSTKNCAVCIPEKPDTSAYSKELNSLDHFVSADSAVIWVRNFRNQYRAILSGKYENDTAFLPLSETFNLKIIDSIIVEPSTIGFRIYPGIKSDNKVHLILAGVDYNGVDAIQRAEAERRVQRFAPPPPAGTVGESGQRNPPGTK